MQTFVRQLTQDGFALVPQLVPSKAIFALIAAIEEKTLARATRGNSTFGARNLLGLDAVYELVRSAPVKRHLTVLLGENYQAVRGLFFDKTEDANWPVLWHQDLSLAVAKECNMPGWSNWSRKHGVLHVQPPASILERMVTMRLHLDDCELTNGPLRVMPGSHSHGILPRSAIAARIGATQDETIQAHAGDALFMRPLLLHASASAEKPSHRRVLHLEFAPKTLLPDEMDWALV